MKKKHRAPKSVRYGLGEKEWRCLQDQFHKQSGRDYLLDHPANINHTMPSVDRTSQMRINAAVVQADNAAKRRQLASFLNAQTPAGQPVSQTGARRQMASKPGGPMSPIGDTAAAAADEAKRRHLATSEHTQVTDGQAVSDIPARRQMASTAAVAAAGGGDGRIPPTDEAQEVQSQAGRASERRHLATSENAQAQEEQDVSETRARRQTASEGRGGSLSVSPELLKDLQDRMGWDEQTVMDKAALLKQCEKMLHRHWKSMVDLGWALLVIRQERLYALVERRSFKDFCRPLRICRSQADRLINYYRVVKSLEGVEHAELLRHEGQVRPLTRIRKADGTLDFERIAAVFARASARAVAKAQRTGEDIYITADIIEGEVNDEIGPPSSSRSGADEDAAAAVVRKSVVAGQPTITLRFPIADPMELTKLLADNVGMDFVANMGKVINQFLSQHADQC